MTTHNTTTNTGNLPEEKPKKSRIILSRLNEKQKAGLRNGSIGLFGLLGGAGIIGLMGSGKANAAATIDNEEPTDADVNEEVAVVETDATFAQGNFDSLSFGDAFAAARDQVGTGGFFEWNGASYNTYTAEEWDTMTEAQQNDFASNLYESSDFQNVQIVKRVEILETKESYDLNNDGNVDVVMEDLDGDGVMEVSEVDLNSDGNIDVIHDAGPEEVFADAEKNEIEVDVNVTVNGETVSSGIGLVDDTQLNEPVDEILDGSFVIAEEETNSVVETVVVDPETVTEDIIEADELEMYIVDEGADVIEMDDIEVVEDELNMDDFTIVEEAQDERVEAEEINEEMLKADDFDIDNIEF